MNFVLYVSAIGDAEKLAQSSFLTSDLESDKSEDRDITVVKSHGNRLLNDARRVSQQGHAPSEQKHGRSGGGEGRQVTLESAALEMRKKRRHRWGRCGGVWGCGDVGAETRRRGISERRTSAVLVHVCMLVTRYSCERERGCANVIYPNTIQCAIELTRSSNQGRKSSKCKELSQGW